MAAAGLMILPACSANGGDDGSAVIVTTTERAESAPTVDNEPTTVPTTVATTSNASTTSTDPSTPSEEPATSTSAGPATTLPYRYPGTTVPEPVVGDPIVRLEPVGEFDTPVDLAFRYGDEVPDAVFYVVEQPGRIVRVEGDTHVTVADLTDRVRSGGERGLLGLAFAPEGDVGYVDYTDADGNTVISELPVGADGTFDTAAERVLLTIDQPYGNHNGGDVDVAPDGTLFIGMGDGGSANDPERRASDPTSLLGALLRIDPTPDADRPYTIPPDNPFAGGEFDGVPGAPEVWAWGLRNPWRFDIDLLTGDLWIADVGQNEYEEIDLVRSLDGSLAGRGANFGWSAFEGTERFNTDVADPGGLTPPVLTYTHADGCSISGGAVYRGSEIEGLMPAYVYSDYCSGTLWALDLEGGRNLTLLSGLSSVTAIRRGPAGLYVLEGGGSIYRLAQG